MTLSVDISIHMIYAVYTNCHIMCVERVGLKSITSSICHPAENGKLPKPFGQIAILYGSMEIVMKGAMIMSRFS